MKAKLLIGVVCFVLGALAGYFGPGIVKAEIEAHKEDSDQAAPELETVADAMDGAEEVVEDVAEEVDETKEE